MQKLAEVLSTSLDKQETMTELHHLLAEYKRTSTGLSEIVEETKQLYVSVQQSCKDLAELEDWINKYTLATEAQVCNSSGFFYHLI